MRIELPTSVERFGAVCFGDLQKVFELDSGMNGRLQPDNNVIQAVSYDSLLNIYKNMAVVVPVCGERIKLVEGVLCGIPHPCLVIIVSNSPRSRVDRFKMESDALHDYCVFTRKNALIAHQKDPALARAFKRTGYTEILGKNGIVRDGKAEGMIIAIILARICGKRYIGFVDADNYFPGSVEEYVREYAAGFYMSRSPYVMVRIAWHSKPKIIESKLFFRKWGRTTMSTNAFLNKFISHYTGFETEIIKTGNAGEHAMTMELAMNMDYSSGYSVEPYHIVNLLERYGGIFESPVPDVMHQKVEVYQIESRNPHLHEAGDMEHIDQMSYLAMQVMYHSTICPSPVKKELLRTMYARGFLKPKKRPDRPRYFPALSNINTDIFLKSIASTPYGKMIKKDICGKH